MYYPYDVLAGINKNDTDNSQTHTLHLQSAITLAVSLIYSHSLSSQQQASLS